MYLDGTGKGKCRVSRASARFCIGCQKFVCVRLHSMCSLARYSYIYFNTLRTCDAGMLAGTGNGANCVHICV